VERFLFWSHLFGVLKLSVPEWTSFLRPEKFYAIVLLNVLHIPLACIASPSMPMIYRFGLLMKSQSSCIFPCSSGFCSGIFQIFSLISILPLSPEILSSTSLLSVFLSDLKNFLFPGFLLDSFFETFHIFVKFLFQSLCYLLYFIFLFFCYNLLSFILEFVKILIEFI
jgi:hypothetical protein